MRTLDALIEAHLSDKRYTVFQLCELIGPSVTYRFTDAPIPIVWGGFTWVNLAFTTGEFVLDNDGEINLTVTFEDVSLTLRAITLANDLNRFDVKVSEVWADPANALYGQDVTAWGTCDGVNCSGEDGPSPSCSIAVRGVFASSAGAIGPRQDYTRNCRYDQFKGPQCKYAGGVTSCDRLFTTCTTLGNVINFGGFRFALGPDEKVNWGGSGTLEGRPQVNYVNYAGVTGPHGGVAPPPTARPIGGPGTTPPAPTTRRRAVG